MDRNSNSGNDQILERKDGRLDTPLDGDCLRGLIILHESATGTKKVATRTAGRCEGRMQEGERAGGGRRMNFTAGVRKVALGRLTVSSFLLGRNTEKQPDHV
jgi:hypothetical protein